MEKLGDDNEVELEKTVYSQLFDFKDQKAGLLPGEPVRSELESADSLIKSIKEALESIRDRQIPRAIEKAGHDADLAPINDIAEAELSAQEERGRSWTLRGMKANQAA
ncbi:hypothetical protein OPQ81_007929 [Rhizoctonia solani]|nr:hypothetical protein OPQ81_007929 [Rhizoctonia solani]